MSISLRLTLVFAILFASVLAAGVLVVQRSITSTTEHAVDDELQLRWEDALEQAAHIEGEPSSEQLLSVADGDALVMDSRSGTVIASRGGFNELSDAERAAISSRAQSLPRENDAPRATFGGLVDGSRALVISIDTRARDRAENRLLAVVVAVSAVLLVVGTLVAYLASRGSLAPVETLRRQARELAERDQLELLEVPAGTDEIHRLSLTLNELLERHHEAIRRERRFVADAGHELRTPIAAIIAEAELGIERFAAERDAGAAFEHIAGSARRLASLSEQLLQLGNTRSTPVDRRSQSLRGIAQEAVVRWRVAHPSVEGDAPHVHGEATAIVDGELLIRAVVNLIDNAYKHGGAPINIDITESQNEVRLSVRDSGPGFPPSFIERAHEPFSRAEESRAASGAGLGLAIVSDIASAHDGTLQLAFPDPATATIILPRT